MNAAASLLTRIERELHHAQTDLSHLVMDITDPATRDQLRKAMVAVKKLRNQLEDLLLTAFDDDEAIP